MQLVGYDLYTQLSQKMIATKNQTIVHIKPHIYISNNPIGGLRLDVYDVDSATLIQSSNELSVASIKSQAEITEPYFHGYIRFDFNGFSILEDQEIEVRLLGVNGYTFSGINFISWASDYDLQRYSRSFIITSNLEAPLDLELYESIIVRKGIYG